MNDPLFDRPQCCELCRFARFPYGVDAVLQYEEFDSDYARAVCRRRAPLPLVIPGPHDYAVGSEAIWPVVSFSDWCGDFQYTREIEEDAISQWEQSLGDRVIDFRGEVLL